MEWKLLQLCLLVHLARLYPVSLNLGALDRRSLLIWARVDKTSSAPWASDAHTGSTDSVIVLSLCLIGLEQRGLNWLGPLVGVDLTAKVFGGGLLG